MKVKSLRSFKVASVLYKAVCETFMTSHHEVFSLCSVSRVEVSSNLRNCNIFIVPSDSTSDHNALLDYLNLNAPSIAYSVSKNIELRIMPDIYFKLDNTCFDFMKIGRIISEVIKN